MSHTTNQVINQMNQDPELAPKLQDMLRTPKAKRIGTAFDEGDLITIKELVKKINTCGSCDKSYYRHSQHGFDLYRCKGCGCDVHERIEHKGCPARLF